MTVTTTRGPRRTIVSGIYSFVEKYLRTVSVVVTAFDYLITNHGLRDIAVTSGRTTANYETMGDVFICRQ